MKKTEMNAITAEKKEKNFWKRFFVPENSKNRIWIHLVCTLLPIASFIVDLFSPFCTVQIGGNIYSICAHGGFFSKNVQSIGGLYYLELVILILLALISAFTVTMFILSLFSFYNEEKLIKKTKISVITGTVANAVFTLFSCLFSPANEALGGSTRTAISFWGLLIMFIVVVLYSLFSGNILMYRFKDAEEDLFTKLGRERRQKLSRELFYKKLELIAYALGSLSLAVITLLSNIFTVTFENSYANIPSFSLTGIRLIANVSSLATQGERVIAYIILALLIIIVTAAFVTLMALVCRSVTFNKLAVGSVVMGSGICLLVGLFGLYYSIIQELNIEMLTDILNQYISVTPDAVSELVGYNVRSFSLIFFLVSLVLLTAVFIRRPYAKILLLEQQIAAEDAAKIPQMIEIMNNEEKSLTASESASDNDGTAESGDAEKKEEPEENLILPPPTPDFDPCPAFTELDAKAEIYDEELTARREALFEEPTLPGLVDFIVCYARGSKEKLYYTNEIIATFFAGLGTTKLSILQGMSGTGKTSLPKIVAKALSSVCDIVEVESSWRDKNELLGYYNEFNKTYTPKKFTQMLYKAKLNSDTLTFIVLDEMNLSRIEYYFSDFLSLMENAPEDRELKLLNVALARTENGERVEYSQLVDGHTVKIPGNVWFIGTANRDESTYDISDKVYDRANTMNFDKRAEKFNGECPALDARYLPAATLTELFENAKQTVDFKLESCPEIAEVEKLLEPYNISFGNRVALQMESFVSIYASCFDNPSAVIRDGLETILLSKVVRKLELKNIDDKEYLARAFDELGFVKCGDFIRKIKED